MARHANYARWRCWSHAPPLLVHTWQRQAHDPERRLQHYPQYRREAFGREIFYGGHVLQARIVHHDIGLDVYAVEHLVVGEIRLHRLATDLVCDLLHRVAIEVEYGYRRARPGQPLGTGTSNTARSLGNQGTAPGQVQPNG